MDAYKIERSFPPETSTLNPTIRDGSLTLALRPKRLPGHLSDSGNSPHLPSSFSPSPSSLTSPFRFSALYRPKLLLPSPGLFKDLRPSPFRLLKGDLAGHPCVWTTWDLSRGLPETTSRQGVMTSYSVNTTNSAVHTPVSKVVGILWCSPPRIFHGLRWPFGTDNIRSVPTRRGNESPDSRFDIADTTPSFTGKACLRPRSRSGVLLLYEALIND